MGEDSLKKEYKSIYLKVGGGSLFSLVGGFIPIVNVIIVFPVFFLLSKSAFKQAVSIPKREGWKRIVTLLVCGGTLVSSVFWWIIALVMLVVSLKEQV